MRVQMLAAILVAGLWSTSAAAAIDITRSEASGAESSINACASQYQGKPLIECVGAALDGLSGGLGKGNISSVAPRAASVTSTAASQVKQSATKAAAVSALNRASSVISGLAASSSGEAQQVYSRIGQVYARAINVINTKG
jgi:hypothetical protein